jgi:uncharacterized membrane protein
MGLYRLSANWLRVVLLLVGIYATLPYVAPALMRAGIEAPARALYTLYSPFCHQMAFRSLFLFGEQAFYPREISGTELTPFEVYAAAEPTFAGIDLQMFNLRLIESTRAFLGNDAMGYKTTLCARDVAIYTMLFIGGLLYSIPAIRRKLRPVPIWLYLLLGITPIGIDGMSQLLSYPPFNLWPVRETAPEFRVLTGALFGLMNAWLAFPYLELSFRETHETLQLKLQRAGLL